MLLPPSAGKAHGGSPTTAVGAFDETLRAPRRAVRRALRDALDHSPSAALEKLLDARGDLLLDAVAGTRALLGRHPPVLPAWQRYTGVVWAHLGPASLTSRQRARILVPSAVYGVTTSADPIGDYRLKLSVRLGELGPLARFWRPHVSRVVAEHARGRTVVDLLPAEHAAAIDWGALGGSCRVLRVEFLAADAARAAGHDAKAVKGAFARLLLTRGVAAGGDFEWRGWHTEPTRAGFAVVAPRRPAETIRSLN